MSYVVRCVRFRVSNSCPQEGGIKRDEGKEFTGIIIYGKFVSVKPKFFSNTMKMSFPYPKSGWPAFKSQYLSTPG